MARLCPAIERELREVEERRRAEKALHFLSEASTELSSSLDYRSTLARVARLTVPRLADWCAVDVVEEDGGVHRLAVEHQDPEKVAWAHKLQERYPPDEDAPRGLFEVLRSGRSDVYPEIPDQMLVAAARGPEHLRIMRELGFTSAMIVPLVARGRTLGAITLVSAESGRRYGRADLELAEELASRAALAVDNARLYDAAQREISERKRAETRYRTLVEQIPAVTYIQEPLESATPKAVTYMSPQYETMFGYERAEVVDEEHWLRTLHPEDRERVLAEEARTDETGKPFGVEYRKLARDGSVVWVRDEAVLVRDEESGPLYWLGIQYDITERKRFEEALKASEERFRAIFEQAAVGVGQVALNGRWLGVNDKLCEITGYRREELLQKTFQDITHPDDLDKDLEQAEQLLNGEIDTYSMEKRYLKRDNSNVWINLTVSLVRGPSGSPEYFIAVVEDIAGRRRVQEALSQSEERYRAVVKQSADGIYLVDGATKRILETNPALQNMLGYTAEELRGMELHQIVAHDRQSVDANVERTLREGWRFIRERSYLRKDGTVVEVEVVASAIHYGGERVICAAIRDITERKLSEMRLAEVREAERNRIARDLHDDILQDIVYALQEIQIAQITSEDGAPAVLDEVAEALRRAVEGLRGAIFELRLNEVLGRSLVSSLEVLLDLNRRMARGRYELVLVVDEGFPDTLPERTGREIVRIVQEALANARRHADPRRVEVRLALEGGVARVEVSDDGGGFDPGRPGVGLGQQSMRHRAHELGGELVVESGPGRGTRVRFEAPLSRLVAGDVGGSLSDRGGQARPGDEGAPTA
jgi:PAS domain S-box-containing protein